MIPGKGSKQQYKPSKPSRTSIRHCTPDGTTHAHKHRGTTSTYVACLRMQALRHKLVISYSLLEKYHKGAHISNSKGEMATPGPGQANPQLLKAALLKEGYLLKRQRGQSSGADLRGLKFQQRYICLTQDFLVYYVDKKVY